jgi:hypothetical protein
MNMGVAQTRGAVYLFDRDQGRVVAVNHEGGVIGSFSRSGNGPGEIIPKGSVGRTIPKSRRADWIHADSSAVVVFDGLKIHIFRPNGEFVDDWMSLAESQIGLPPAFTTRVRRYGESNIIDVESLFQGGTSPSDALLNRVFSLYQVDDDSARRIFAMDLVELPTMISGGVYHGPLQASPLWDLYGRCAAISDGGSGHILLARLDSSHVDTVVLGMLPAQDNSIGSEADILKQMGHAEEVPDPTLLKRFSKLIVDPLGWVWIEIWKRRSVGEASVVVRVNLESGEVVRDTVPAFPHAFLSEDQYVGVRSTVDGDEELILVKRIPKG